MDGASTIGGSLRARREERGLSLEQAAFQGRVPLRLVQLLEGDDYHLVPDAGYLIRFLRDYARFLGLEPEGLEAAFRTATRTPPRASLAPPQPPPPNLNWRHFLWTVAALMVMVPLVFITLSLSARREAERAVPPPPAEPTPAERIRAEEQAAVSAEPTTPAPSPEGVAEPPAAAPPLRGVAAPAPVAAEVPRSGFVLLAEADEVTWMAVQPDGGAGRDVLLQPGQAIRFQANREFVVTVGNAGGVRLSLNGARLPVLGKSGEVVRNLILPSGSVPRPAGSP